MQTKTRNIFILGIMASAAATLVACGGGGDDSPPPSQPATVSGKAVDFYLSGSTVAGFALSVLKRLPQTGEQFRHDHWTFEVVDMDGRKIDKLLISAETD